MLYVSYSRPLGNHETFSTCYLQFLQDVYLKDVAVYVLFMAPVLVLCQDMINPKIQKEANVAAKIKILAISSDPIMLKLFQQNLSESGFEVASTQYTGEELRIVLDRELPELVILDIMMPSMDGIEVCLGIRQWSQVPIMMLSAWGAGEGKVRRLDLSAYSYLTEPFGMDELMVRIKETLQFNFAAANLLADIHSGAS